MIPVDPSKFQGKVGTNVGKASVQTGCEAFLLRGLAKESEQVLNNFSILRFVGGVNAVLPHTIVLRELDRLIPLLVVAVDVCRDATELQQLVGGEFRSQGNHVEVVETINRLAEAFVVLFLHIKLPTNKY